ncbi:MAG: response regulator transcription factor [Acidobacteria bacterium]|nr:response regulator transcription factor [Acidobacteriota bacterium]
MTSVAAWGYSARAVQSEGDDVLTALTDRERQIICLVTEGLSNKKIGRGLNVTEGTIKVHLHNIFGKLGVSNRTELAALALLQDQAQVFSRGPSSRH